MSLTGTGINNEFSTCGAASTVNISMFEDANNNGQDVSLEDNKNSAGENINSSILDQTALSDTSSSLECSSIYGDSNSQDQTKRKACALTIGISLLVGIVVGLVAFGIGKAVGRDKRETQMFQGAAGQITTSTETPSVFPSDSPFLKPAYSPTKSPTKRPSSAPSPKPTPSATPKPTPGPTRAPTGKPTPVPTYRPATYVPGNLTHEEVGLLLSEGLRARIIATTGEPVEYHDGSLSEELFHGRPDFGATFADRRPFNEGGWVYASNSEMPEEGAGGVGSVTFDRDGNIIDYRMVLVNTTMNCGGGKSPW
jgi:hypothetical protein